MLLLVVVAASIILGDLVIKLIGRLFSNATVAKKPTNVQKLQVTVDNEVSKTVSGPILQRSYDKISKTINNEVPKPKKRLSNGDITEDLKRGSKKQKQENAEKPKKKNLKPEDIQMTVVDNRGKKKSNREYDSITISAKGRSRQVEQEPEPELEYYSDEYFSAEETEEQPPKKNVKKEASEKPRNKKSKSKLETVSLDIAKICDIIVKSVAENRKRKDDVDYKPRSYDQEPEVRRKPDRAPKYADSPNHDDRAPKCADSPKHSDRGSKRGDRPNRDRGSKYADSSNHDDRAPKYVDSPKRVDRAPTRERKPKNEKPHYQHPNRDKSPKVRSDKVELEMLHQAIASRTESPKNGHSPKKKTKVRDEPSKKLTPPPRVPSTAYFLAQASKVQISDQVWYPGDERVNWLRPCFADYEFCALGDSQLKVYGKNGLSRPGYNISSYSGADILELLHVLDAGYLEPDQTGRVNLTRQTRLEISSGARAFTRTPNCTKCGRNCMANFTGHLILGIGLNNSLKADQAAFRGQNISQIFNLMDQTLARLFPKVKSIYYVPPIAIDREQTPHAIQIYNQLLEQVSKRRHSKLDPNIPSRRGWIQKRDQVHLIDQKATVYWEDNFDDIERQIAY